jgi:hypothetical protein
MQRVPDKANRAMVPIFSGFTPSREAALTGFRKRTCRALSRSAVALGLFVALAGPMNLHAEVFMRLGRGALALEQLGGTRLHSTDVRINGQPGRLAAYGFDAAAAVLAPDLRKALPMPELGAGKSMATHVTSGQSTTLLLLPGSGPRNCVAILIEQTAEAHRKTKAAPAEWPGGLAYPEAVLLFSAENVQTRTTLAVATTADAPEAASGRMETVLAGAGWVRMPPLAATPGLTLYAQGSRICAFSATAGDGPGGKTRITVLQRLGTTP